MLCDCREYVNGEAISLGEVYGSKLHRTLHQIRDEVDVSSESIRLHIVAPDERREKVFREMLRPVFSLLERGPLSKSCTFISYESVNQISEMDHLSHMNDSIIKEYEEHSESL
jgi:hypothetical protein